MPPISRRKNQAICIFPASKMPSAVNSCAIYWWRRANRPGYCGIYMRILWPFDCISNVHLPTLARKLPKIDQLSWMHVANNPVRKGTCIFQEVRQYCTCFPSIQVKVLFRFAMAWLLFMESTWVSSSDMVALLSSTLPLSLFIWYHKRPSESGMPRGWCRYLVVSFSVVLTDIDHLVRRQEGRLKIGF